MGQVPQIPTYLIIGDGRLARHLFYYFSEMPIEVNQWNRRQHSPELLNDFINQADYTLLCIPDSQIANFVESHQQSSTEFIHFSGAFHSNTIVGFHPLMTFGEEIYEKSLYEDIHFIGTTSLDHFYQVFPFLKNSYSQIKPEQKALYHALCVLSGNGTTLLWDITQQELQQIGVPKEALHLYLHQTTKNILSDKPGRWTGPWYRSDQETINKNEIALKSNQLQSLYQELHQLSHRSGHYYEKH